LVWGQNRDRFGAVDGYLADASIHLSRRDHLYLRGERVRNDFADAGYHLLDPTEVVVVQAVGEATAGYVRDIGKGLGVGADVNLYVLPPSAGGVHDATHGYHVFLRFHASMRREPRQTGSND
jgi:hypothetical protein